MNNLQEPLRCQQVGALKKLSEDLYNKLFNLSYQMHINKFFADINIGEDENNNQFTISFQDMQTFIQRVKQLNFISRSCHRTVVQMEPFIKRIKDSTEETTLDDIWDEELQTVRSATSDEQTINEYRREVQYQFQLKIAADPNFLVDETERDDLWDEELQTLRPATNEEQAIIESAREKQYQLQLDLDNKVEGGDLGSNITAKFQE